MILAMAKMAGLHGCPITLHTRYFACLFFDGDKKRILPSFTLRLFYGQLNWALNDPS